MVVIAAASVGAVGCEDGGQAPRTPQATASYGPGGGYGTSYASQYGSSFTPSYGWPPPGQPMPSPAPERRRLDLSLDVPTAAATPLPAWLDTRDPFAGGSGAERRSDATSGGAPVATATRQLPATHLLIALSVEKIGNHAARANAARKVLAGHGAVKRSDNLWEVPSDGPDKSADTVRAELTKLLCFDDRAALFFADGGRMVKLEVAGEQPCEGGK
ncbi:MAG: hypothetical protein WKG00_32425 [Polyangiaceae bacterium]